MNRYNSEFYATTAVVIPVLFLTLTLQGDFLLNFFLTTMRLASKEERALKETPVDDLSPKAVWSGTVKRLAFEALTFVGVGVLILSLCAEAVSLYCIENQTSYTIFEHFVFWMCIALLLSTLIAFNARVFSSVLKSQAKRNSETE